MKLLIIMIIGAYAGIKLPKFGDFVVSSIDGLWAMILQGWEKLQGEADDDTIEKKDDLDSPDSPDSPEGLKPDKSDKSDKRE